MCHPPGIRKFVHKAHPQNTRADVVILYAGGTGKVGARRARYFRFLFILHIPGRFGSESAGWRPPAQMLDLFSHLVAYRAGDDQPVGTVMLFTPAGEIILLPLVHDLTEPRILSFVPFILFFLGQLLPIGIPGFIHPQVRQCDNLLPHPFRQRILDRPRALRVPRWASSIRPRNSPHPGADRTMPCAGNNRWAISIL